MNESTFRDAGENDWFLETARRLHQALLEGLDLRRAQIERLDARSLRERAAVVLAQVCDRDRSLPDSQRDRLQQFVLDETLGLGPLEPLLRDDSVSEIMVNGPSTIYIERAGRLIQTDAAFSSEASLRGIVERMVGAVGRRVDEASPMVDARLVDGSRVNVVLQPVALRGPCITIRRFARRLIAPKLLIEQGSVDAEALALLKNAVETRRNILVSGGTGSGKTTLLNLLASYIDENERIVTIEDAAELSLQHPHCVSLEARPANAEGRGEITIRELLRNALRMRPDRILIGECRGAESLDMLQAMNTGHQGSLTTIHANGPREALSRLEVMAHMAGLDLPALAIREQIAGAVHLVVQLARFANGERRVTRVTEIAGMEGNTVLTQDVFPRHPALSGCEAW